MKCEGRERERERGGGREREIRMTKNGRQEIAGSAGPLSE